MMKLRKRQSSHWLEGILAIASSLLIASLSTTQAQAAITVEANSSEAESVSLPLSFFPENKFCPQDLSQAITAIASRPQFATASWGILIQPLTDETALYTHNADDFLIPASNIKLLTTAAALEIMAERSPETLPAIADEILTINRDSNNAMADALLQDIGGQSTVRQALEPLGVRPDSYVQADGSGLSRNNKVKPATFVTLLQAMATSDVGHIFYTSLPTGGVDGTLRNRFKETPVQGRVHAKTGTLNGVRALSGYLETDDYGTVAFSIVVNQPGQAGATMLAAIDEMVLTMAQVQPCY